MLTLLLSPLGLIDHVVVLCGIYMLLYYYVIYQRFSYNVIIIISSSIVVRPLFNIYIASCLLYSPLSYLPMSVFKALDIALMTSDWDVPVDLSGREDDMWKRASGTV